MEPSTPHPGDIVSIRISGDFSAEWLHGVTAMYQVFEHSSWRGTAILIAEWSNRPRVIPLPYTGPIDLSLVGILPWVALKYQIPEGAGHARYRICKTVGRARFSETLTLCT
jgi:hypothetical protein